MHPGSGPSDRDNDVYFPPIRDYLVERGIGVASFDKRGIGGSTGRWEDAAIEKQADDALACFGALRSTGLDGVPIGLYGHSQGGWVVVEAASRDADVAFVIANSGPGVTPGEQERYATRGYMRRHRGRRASGRRVLLRPAPRPRTGSRAARGRPPDDRCRGLPGRVRAPRAAGPSDDAAVWELLARLVDYDPRRAVERIRVPVLALFGEEDDIVPVEESVRVYREAVAPELLTVRVFPGGNHRLQAGDPPVPVDGYLATLASFVLASRDSMRPALR